MRRGALALAAGLFLGACGQCGPVQHVGSDTQSLTIAIDCTGSGQLCRPVYSVQVHVQEDSFGVTYRVPGHCSSLRLHLWADGGPQVTSGWLGWPGAGGRFASLPLSYTTTLGPLSGAAHVLHVQAEGQVGGCNGGGIGSWGGTLTLRGATASP